MMKYKTFFRRLLLVLCMTGVLSQGCFIQSYAEEPAAEAEVTEDTEAPAPPQTEAPAPPQTEAPAPPQTEAPVQTEDEQIPQTEMAQTEMIQAEAMQTELVIEEVTQPEAQSEAAAKEKNREQKEETEEKEAEETPAASGATSEISGFTVDPSKYPAANVNETTNHIYKYLIQVLELNHAGACGVLANIQLESDFNPLALGDGGTSYGLCQWHLGRFNALIAHCNSIGLDYNTVDGQLDYMAQELTWGYNGTLEFIRNVPNTSQGAYDAAHYFCTHFEIPDQTELRAQQRGNVAMNEFFWRDFSEAGLNEENAEAGESQDAAAALVANIRKQKNEEKQFSERIKTLVGSSK